ncbi:hypothetical protein diail_8143 [Diaporthe ilicicola]|nr:hypothetical protein diail_8143 [Diaporthe ilicicola]
MDSTIVKRRAHRNAAFEHPHFRGASTARGCATSARNELTHRVSVAARRLKTRGLLLHDDRGFMELFWQDGDGAVVAGETIVVVAGSNDGKQKKLAVADHIDHAGAGRRSARLSAGGASSG